MENSVTGGRYMRAEQRILSVLSLEKPMNQREVTVAARLDSALCSSTLLLLVDLGYAKRTVARTGRQGRPAYLYLKVAQA